MNEFGTLSTELSILIEEWEPKLSSLSNEVITNRCNSQNRTIRQITGHMVDSASNNTHRIIHLQYQNSSLLYPDYANLGNNDRWIALQNYQEEEWNLLVQLWKYSHLHIAHVIRNIDPDKLGNEWISALDEKITLKAMILDFPRHFQLHLDEIEELINME